MPPAEAREFCDWLCAEGALAAGALQGKSFSVCALGDRCAIIELSPTSHQFANQLACCTCGRSTAQHAALTAGRTSTSARAARCWTRGWRPWGASASFRVPMSIGGDAHLFHERLHHSRQPQHTVSQLVVSSQQAQ